MNIVILGGMGYIGAHLAKHLIANNHTVTIIDRKSESTLAALIGIPPSQNIRVDLDECHPRQLAERIKQNGISTDLVIHLADEKNICEVEGSEWCKLTGESKVPKEDILNNVVRTPPARAVSALKLTHELGAKRLVYASSGAVYEDGRPPMREGGVALGTKSVYASYKVQAETALMDFHKDLGIQVTVLRYGNPIGCKFGLTYGLFDDSVSLGAAITRFISGHVPMFTVDQHSEGDPFRSFIDIQRLCTATTKVIVDQDGVLQDYDVFNIGGATVSPRQILLGYFSHHGIDYPEDKISNRRLEHYRHKYNVISSIKFETLFKMSLQSTMGELVSGIR